MNMIVADSWLWQPLRQNLHSVCLSTSLLPKNNCWFNPLCSAALYLVSVNYFVVYCICFQKIKYTITVTSKILFGIRWRRKKQGLRLWAKVPSLIPTHSHNTVMCYPSSTDPTRTPPHWYLMCSWQLHTGWVIWWYRCGLTTTKKFKYPKWAGKSLK